MSAYTLLIRHRTVDLVAASAGHCLRETLGLSDRLGELRRDDGFVIEGASGGDAASWAQASAQRAEWCNPNTHRHAFFESRPGVLDAASGGEWPSPWLGRMVHSDRADLAESGARGDLESWLAFAPSPGGWVVSLAAWDSEDAVSSLPRGQWPDGGARVLHFSLWSLAVRAANASEAMFRAEEMAITRRRPQGLLIHPHMERWAAVGEPISLSPQGV